jgi:hypothetical protein
MGHRPGLPQPVMTLVFIALAFAVIAYQPTCFPVLGHMEKVFILLCILFSRFMGAANCSHTLKGKKGCVDAYKI